MTSDHDAMAATLAARYSAAVNSLNVADLVALYAEDVVLFDAFLPDPVVGRQAWSECVEAWFGGSTQVAEVTVSRVVPGADLLTVLGTVRYSELGPDGRPSGGVTNRLSWTVRPGADGFWLIVHEHTSVPVDLDAGTALLT